MNEAQIFEQLVENIINIPDDEYKWESENIAIKVAALKKLCEEFAERLQKAGDERRIG